MHVGGDLSSKKTSTFRFLSLWTYNNHKYLCKSYMKNVNVILVKRANKDQFDLKFKISDSTCKTNSKKCTDKFNSELK